MFSNNRILRDTNLTFFLLSLDWYWLTTHVLVQLKAMLEAIEITIIVKMPEKYDMGKVWALYKWDLNAWKMVIVDQDGQESNLNGAETRMN